MYNSLIFSTKYLCFYLFIVNYETSVCKFRFNLHYCLFERYKANINIDLMLLTCLLCESNSEWWVQPSLSSLQFQPFATLSKSLYRYWLLGFFLCSCAYGQITSKNLLPTLITNIKQLQARSVFRWGHFRNIEYIVSKLLQSEIWFGSK